MFTLYREFSFSVKNDRNNRKFENPIPPWQPASKNKWNRGPTFIYRPWEVENIDGVVDLKSH